VLSPFHGSCLRWCAPLLSGFAFFLGVFDWLHAGDGDLAARRKQLLRTVGVGSAIIALVGLTTWAGGLPERIAEGSLFEARNPFPLGHSNYTAGLALLMLPCFGALIAAERGRLRVAWGCAFFLAVLSLATSGSRGGWLGAIALTATFLPTL